MRTLGSVDGFFKFVVSGRLCVLIFAYLLFLSLSHVLSVVLLLSAHSHVFVLRQTF